jgi:uncharacterized protein YjbJ (UPF0337 family)
MAPVKENAIMAGRTEELKGSVKEAAGNLTGNEQWQAEGRADKAAGKAEREAAGARDTVAGHVKKGAGDLLDNEQLQAEGEAQKLKGRAERAG